MVTISLLILLDRPRAECAALICKITSVIACCPAPSLLYAGGRWGEGVVLARGAFASDGRGSQIRRISLSRRRYNNKCFVEK